MFIGGYWSSFGNFDYLCKNYRYEKNFIPIYIYSRNRNAVRLQKQQSC